ncbi:MAG: 2-oxoglutarate dehydrogenase, E2 component, dihydrolipoamide succinyltransferase, partial [Jiangellaceae bacterium]|nr:2-oxoglutarate dehydrogenase, E2 component, dihydrolipoamide succinyltransferase [Jiangellaceae bacterium]
MATSVTLPALGESVSEGTVTRWLKQPGEEVQADEPLVEISTDKVDTELPSPASGTLLEIKVAVDETVAVGTELAVIGQPSEGGGAADEPAAAAPAQEAPAQPEPSAEEQPEPAAGQAAPPEGEAQPAAEQQPQPAAEQQPQPAAEQPAPGEEPQPATAGAAGGTPVTLPALGESVTEGTVTRWLKGVGDQVQLDEPLLEISTDKVDTEIPSPAAGTLLEIKVGEDETVQVGTELAVIGTAGAPAQAAEPRPAATPEHAAEGAETPLAAEAAERAAAEAQSLEKTERAAAPAAPAEPAEPAQPAAEPAAAETPAAQPSAPAPSPAAQPAGPSPA